MWSAVGMIDDESDDIFSVDYANMGTFKPPMEYNLCLDIMAEIKTILPQPIAEEIESFNSWIRPPSGVYLNPNGIPSCTPFWTIIRDIPRPSTQ